MNAPVARRKSSSDLEQEHIGAWLRANRQKVGSREAARLFFQWASRLMTCIDADRKKRGPEVAHTLGMCQFLLMGLGHFEGYSVLDMAIIQRDSLDVEDGAEIPFNVPLNEQVERDFDPRAAANEERASRLADEKLEIEQARELLIKERAEFEAAKNEFEAAKQREIDRKPSSPDGETSDEGE